MASMAQAIRMALHYGEQKLGVTEIFGEDRVTVSHRLDDAIDKAVALAESAVRDASLGGAGVVVTGSVVTAGDAARLLRRRY